MLRLTPSRRLALSVLGALALAGCAPAPSVTPPGAAPQAPSQPLQVQGLLNTVIERMGLEPSPYHEVEIDSYFELILVAPVAERASIPQGRNVYGLIPDPENADRFTQTDAPDAPGVTHLGYYPDEWPVNYSPDLVAERGGVKAVRIGEGSDGDFMRFAFPQAAEGPITITGSTENAALFRWEDDEPVVYRQFTFGAEMAQTVDNAREAVAVFSVTNMRGEPINGLTKEHVRFVMTTPEYDGAWAYPYDTLEPIAAGKYRIRAPFITNKASGTVRLVVEVVNPGVPINAVFYRR